MGHWVVRVCTGKAITYFASKTTCWEKYLKNKNTKKRTRCFHAFENTYTINKDCR
jgi:hypothetical protein